MSERVYAANLLASLREETGARLKDCRRALDLASRDVDRAKHLLRRRGLAVAHSYKFCDICWTTYLYDTDTTGRPRP